MLKQNIYKLEKDFFLISFNLFELNSSKMSCQHNRLIQAEYPLVFLKSCGTFWYAVESGSHFSVCG